MPNRMNHGATSFHTATSPPPGRRIDRGPKCETRRHLSTGDRSRFEKAAEKVLDIFSDGRIRDNDLMYVAFYTVINAYPEVVLDRLIDFTEHVKHERKRVREEQNGHDALF